MNRRPGRDVGHLSSRGATDRAFRIPVLAVIVALLVVGGLVDRVGHSGSSAAGASPAPAQANPSVATSSALSSSWYCAGSTLGSGSAATGTVVASNLAGTPVSGTLSAVSDNGTSAVRAISVPAHSQQGWPISGLVSGSYAAATVELNGGKVVVAQQVSGPLGVSEALCASSTASQWYLGSGSTLQGDTLLLALYNPAATDAITDVSFSTNNGLSEPSDYQGLLVPAGRLVVVDVGLRVQNDSEVATLVNTRIGRLVVAQLSERTSGQQSLSLELGAPSLATQWRFPFSLSQPGVSETFYLLNPASQRTARVRISFDLASGEAEPLELSVPPLSQVSVATANQARIPPGTPYSTTVSAANGAPVLAQRSTTYSAPSGYQGRADMLGAASPSSTSVFPPAVGASGQGLGIQAPGPGPAKVTVAAVHGGKKVAIPSLTDVTVVPGRPTALDVPAAVTASNAALVVTSSAPVNVERDQDDANGVSAMAGIPPA